MQVSADNAGLASGAVCLSAFVYAGADALMSMNQMQTPGEHAGGAVPAILSIISRLLQPDAVTDMGALGVGGLITQVVLKLQPVLDPAAVQNMFHAILIRLVSAKFSSLKQNHNLVFARLMHRDMGTVMRVVGNLPGRGSRAGYERSSFDRTGTAMGGRTACIHGEVSGEGVTVSLGEAGQRAYKCFADHSARGFGGRCQ